MRVFLLWLHISYICSPCFGGALDDNVMSSNKDTGEDLQLSKNIWADEPILDDKTIPPDPQGETQPLRPEPSVNPEKNPSNTEKNELPLGETMDSDVNLHSDKNSPLTNAEESEEPVSNEDKIESQNPTATEEENADEDTSSESDSPPTSAFPEDVCEEGPQSECDQAPLPECSCSSLEESSTTCEGSGRISSQRYNGHCIYKLPVDKEQKLLVYFMKSDISTLSDSCWFNVSGRIYDKDDLADSENFFAALNDVTVFGMRGEETCSWNITYRIEKKKDEQVKDLFCKRGVVKPPRDSSCLENRPLRTNFTWNLSSREKNNCRIQFNVTYLDIGLSIFGNESSLSLLDSVDDIDYLVIGSGRWSGQGEEEIGDEGTIVYGYTEEPFLLNINSCSAYIRYVSRMRYEYPQDFEVEFNIIEESTKSEDAVIHMHPPLPFGYMVDTWVALNGVKKNMSEKNVKKGLAAMANDYLRDSHLEGNITDEDVYILTVTDCHLVYCQVNCMAFNFIIHFGVNGTWVFRRNILNHMLVLYSSKHYFGSDIELCLEFYDSTWKALGMLIIVLSMMGAFVAVIFCMAREKSQHLRGRSTFNRWRNSSTRSIESLSSQTTIKSYSVPLPGFGNDFAWYPPTEKKKEVKNDFGQFYSNNISEANNGEKEGESKSSAAEDAAYSNATFAPEVDEKEIYSKGANAIMESEDSDSDFESFFSRKGVYHVSGMDTGEAVL